MATKLWRRIDEARCRYTIHSVRCYRRTRHLRYQRRHDLRPRSEVKGRKAEREPNRVSARIRGGRGKVPRCKVYRGCAENRALSYPQISLAYSEQSAYNKYRGSLMGGCATRRQYTSVKSSPLNACWNEITLTR